MKILGFYLGLHDSNLSAVDTTSGKVSYCKSERLLGVKRHRATLDFVFDYCTRHDFKPDVIVYSDGKRNGLGECPVGEVVSKVLRSHTPFFEHAKWYHLDHHLAHVLSGWPVVPIDSVEWGIAIDGRGDHSRRISVFRRPAQLQPPVASTEFYRVCHLLDEIGERMKLNGHLADHAGKIMGIQAYGVPDESFVSQSLKGKIANDLRSLILNKADADFNTNDPKFVNWIATIHRIIEQLVIEWFERFVQTRDVVLYSGGCALNTVINMRLGGLYPNLRIPPHCYDGGISLGCVEAARLLTQQSPWTIDDYPFIQSDEDMGAATKSTVLNAAEALAQGKLVGWCQGHGEVGPRALGHRSLLLSPHVPNGKSRINQVKRREMWRPFAPSVLYEAQNLVTGSPKYLPHMLECIAIDASRRPMLGPGAHVDGTSRIQSVDPSKCAELDSYAQLIERLGALTGVPCVINTSYNAGGDPIVASRAAAIEMFRSSNIDALVLGDEFFSK